MAVKSRSKKPLNIHEAIVINNHAKIKFYRRMALWAFMTNIVLLGFLQNKIMCYDFLFFNYCALMVYKTQMDILCHATKPVYIKGGEMLYPGWNLKNAGPGDVFKESITITALAQILSVICTDLYWLMLLVPVRLSWVVTERYIFNKCCQSKKKRIVLNEKKIKNLQQMVKAFKQKIEVIDRTQRLIFLEKHFYKSDYDTTWENKCDELLTTVQLKIKMIQEIKDLHELEEFHNGKKFIFELPAISKQQPQVEFVNEIKPSSQVKGRSPQQNEASNMPPVHQGQSTQSLDLQQVPSSVQSAEEFMVLYKLYKQSKQEQQESPLGNMPKRLSLQ